MRKLIGALALAAAVAAPAAASAEIDDTFGNTVLSRYPDGGWVKHWFNPDGTYAAHFSDGRRLSARWAIQGERICLSNIRPSMLLPRFCTSMIDADVGQTWQARDPLGRRVRNVLVAGRN